MKPFINKKEGVSGESTYGAPLLGAKGALEPWFPLKIDPLFQFQTRRQKF